ncbi:MAG: glycine radical domain-containing protein [Desulfobacterales bacterium]
MNRLDYTKFANGINFNIKFDGTSFQDAAGRNALSSMLDVYFMRGGMQIQVNMLDSRMLIDARDSGFVSQPVDPRFRILRLFQ